MGYLDAVVSCAGCELPRGRSATGKGRVGGAGLKSSPSSSHRERERVLRAVSDLHKDTAGPAPVLAASPALLLVSNTGSLERQPDRPVWSRYHLFLGSSLPSLVVIAQVKFVIVHLCADSFFLDSAPGCSPQG